MRPDAAASTSYASPTTQDALRTIGEVLSELNEEFPELTTSKVRFLEERGLISPQRTPAGYRKFASSDVDRLRLILLLQRDHHMPLVAIREHLAAVDSGDTVGLAGIRPRLVSDVGSARPTQERPTRLRRREFLALTGASSELLNQLQEYNVVPAPPSGFYSQTDQEITTLAVHLAAYGIEPRHLRGIKASADREASLITQITSPLRRQRQGAEPDAAQEAQTALVGLCARLYAAMLGASSQ